MAQGKTYEQRLRQRKLRSFRNASRMSASAARNRRAQDAAQEFTDLFDGRQFALDRAQAARLRLYNTEQKVRVNYPMTPVPGKAPTATAHDGMVGYIAAVNEQFGWNLRRPLDAPRKSNAFTLNLLLYAHTGAIQSVTYTVTTEALVPSQTRSGSTDTSVETKQSLGDEDQLFVHTFDLIWPRDPEAILVVNANIDAIQTTAAGQPYFVDSYITYTPTNTHRHNF